MSKLISIIIPTYNRANLIIETLNSIAQQTYKNWECIIIDDGSTDNTEELLAAYLASDNRFQYYKRPKERLKGPNSCRNYGFELSKGDYIKWFDSDDILLPKALETISNNFLNHPDLIVSSLQYIDFNNKVLNKKHSFRSENVIQDYMTAKITYYTFTPTWKRGFLILQPNLFDETITNLDDWDFNLRMLYQNPVVIYLDEEHIQYRVHNESLSHEIGKLNFKEIKSEFKAIKKHISLVKENKAANANVLKAHLKNRCKFILRDAAVQNNKHKFYYLEQLLLAEIKLFQFSEMIKTIIGFTVYSIFKKGYKLL
ncbi:glycosyltransferase family 2 protein [Flavobacterium chungbukense]|uniref:Glycosyltransferase 2-like domain-containing protein n=1 Tax=Flavobacterium chungbukense TaxID=877464 RepID=A0ABP7XJY7_9FLAO|nr:glycosyltransferase family 2 protein [Flavobacterium chungbukense]MCC4922945.1 glycosyltransferase family 2 protein [Flavobacterium chungbukense]